MAIESLAEQPIFATEETNYIQESYPLSRLAVFSFLLGILSLCTLYSPSLLLLPVLSVTLGVVGYFQTTRGSSYRGAGLALAGIALALTFGAWGITSTRMRDEHFYQSGGELAEHYVELLADQKVLEAFELMQAENIRQVAGTSLEEFYAKAENTIKESLESFKSDEFVKKIVNRGNDSEWKYSGGVRIQSMISGSHQIAVALVDLKHPEDKPLEVTLHRHLKSDHGATWQVQSLKQ